VTEPNSVFDTGTVLDGRNTYFTRVAPVLDVDVETSYAADAASDIDISFESVLVTQNVGSDAVRTVYWDEAGDADDRDGLGRRTRARRRPRRSRSTAPRSTRRRAR